MEPIIKVENLGKSYIIGHQREKYVALRDVLTNKARQVASKTKNLFSGGQLIAGNELEEFWALKDINFEVQQGDRVGIIGRNGAGKSTLLKVLSRITEPTTGSIRLRGRVASLLEVGTGFHPELSGRENIYLNGAILGMSRAEVKKKFDEIVDFAGVEKFLDTPVKRYSSGMYVRLAFAVAAHLEPEILIIDEVLAVGDAEFQKKCLGKMEDVSKNEGRTVLFVSHNMAAIATLCNKGLLLQNGTIIQNGPINLVIDEYSKNSNSIAEYIYDGNVKNQFGYFKKIQLVNSKKEISNTFQSGETPFITIEYSIKQKFKNYNTGMIVKDILGNHIYSSADTDLNPENQIKEPGNYVGKVQLQLYNLNTGKYKLEFLMGIINTHLFDKVELDFTIDNQNFLNTGHRPGLLLSMNRWEYQK